MQQNSNITVDHVKDLTTWPKEHHNVMKEPAVEEASSET